ncbi:zinc knuckle-domain-containing protein [Diplogelasinospora grovesii]|uniref:Zinc knuckle-domain-containing protein n=1 Tax=Diplogelasinospora grovesii TaxID=303347 RepID=A0AAN6NHJ6_9PEZI|nr:zinc knuckle-domain-containing protein [Diplogelasinospora grovesii]
MYSYRGRAGPSKSTPANVQCQKCLKRGHYSYECKATTQERPYIARPTRTQQLLNPKLAPKLTTETLNPLEKKKGIADEELAKKEAERKRARSLEEEEPRGSPSREHRSRSVSSADSVSSYSTRSPSPRPSNARRSPSPRRERSRDSHYRSVAREQSYRSQIPVQSHSSRRPPADDSHKQRQSREPIPRDEGYRYDRGAEPDDSMRYGRSHSPPPPPPRRDYSRSRSRSRSPSRSPPRRQQPPGSGRYRDRDDYRPQRRDGPPRPPPRRQEPPPPPRERSLSPFSKRLALTQAMNRGGSGGR